MYLLTQHVAELDISSNSTFECKILLWVTYGQLRCLLFHLQKFFFSLSSGEKNQLIGISVIQEYGFPKGQ